MARKCTGLRNRFRSGRGTYSIKRKRTTADRYGTYVNGRPTAPEVISGRSVWW